MDFRSFSLDWHRQSLFNLKQYFNDKNAQLAVLQSEIDRTKAEIDFYALQIKTAEERGLDSLFFR